MAAQQRYTPVPGMAPSSSEMSQLRYGDYSGATAKGSRGGTGSELDNYYGGDVPAVRPESPSLLSQADTSQPHRFSAYSDTPSRPVSTATFSAPFLPNRSSDLSSKDLPLPPGLMGYSVRSGLAHQNVPSEAYWPVPDGGRFAPQPAKRGRKRWLLIGGIVLGAIALIGIIAGVLVSRKKGGPSSSSSSNANTRTSNLGNPSDFAKDPKLHQSFYGFAYTPNDAQPPWCGTTQPNVTRDIQILSQLTTRLRLYGGNCNETALVLQAIQDTKVNMTIWPAIYVDSNETAYTQQLVAVQNALKTYGVDHIEGIIVGNEYILDIAPDPTSAAYTTAIANIASKISSVKSTIQGMNLGKTLPIGTSDAGSILSKALASDIDFFMANVHPYFGSLPIDQAAEWTNSFFQEFDVSVAAEASNNPQTYIAETGWPTGSLNASDASDGAGSPQGDASVANLQSAPTIARQPHADGPPAFLDTFVCQANTNGTQYFYFEAFDEPWKAQYGGVEPFWGLFDSNRNLKNITIPSCS